MADPDREASPGGDPAPVTETLRKAIERTLAATAPRAAETRERAEGLVGEISKRGQEAREEIARRGQDAGAELARRGHEARELLARGRSEAETEVRGQLEALERRLASIEELLRRGDVPESAADESQGRDSKPEPES